MRRTSPFLVACTAVLVLVGAVALGARNSSGTYALPSGNPVVSGTTISSQWANSTLSDIGTELTDSLDRYGRGAMLAQFKAVDGTVSSPGISFSSEQTSGLYRAASGDVRLSALDTQVQKWTSAASEISLPLTCDEGVTVTNSSTNGAGLAATGNGTGDGVLGTGGSSNGIGVKGTGAGTGMGVWGVGGSAGGAGVQGNGSLGSVGVYGVGNGVAEGVRGQGGGTSGAGVIGLGGAPSGIGVAGTGYGIGQGGYFTAGTTSTGALRSDAVKLVDGDLNLDGVANPSASTTEKNRLTPTNLVKAWAHLTGTSGNWSITSGFNALSVSASSTTLTLTTASAFATAEGGVWVTPTGTVSSASVMCTGSIATTTTIQVHCYSNDGTAVVLSGVSVGLNVLALGAQ